MSKEYNSFDILKHIENGYLETERSIEQASMIKIVPIPIDGIAEGEPLYITLSDDHEKAIQKAIVASVKEKRRRITNLVPKQVTKVFREHRGGLAESLETTIECPNGLSDIKAHYKDSILRHFIKDMYIQENAIPDDRLPYVWGGKSYNVIARSIENDSEFVIGQCNFYE